MSDLKQMYTTVMDDHFPGEMTITFGDQVLTYRKRAWKLSDADGNLVEKGLRYGENPGQEAALYELVNGNLVLGEVRFIEPGRGLISALGENQMVQAGKHPGKINLTDADNGLNVLRYLPDKPACVILKHNNPCGVAMGDSLADVFQAAYMADRIAAFGGCAVVNVTLDQDTAEAMSNMYLEVVVAPDYGPGAVDVLARRPNLRILEVPRLDKIRDYRAVRFVDFKSLMDGGIIVQASPFNRVMSKDDLTPASCQYQGRTYQVDRQPTESEYQDILFGWAVEQGVTSNSVLFVKDGRTIGIGTGEQDRVGVAEIAVFKAYTKYADRLSFERFGLPYKELELLVNQGQRPGEQADEINHQAATDKAGLPGSTMVSDAFFPFRDGVDVGLKQGATAVVHPGGSFRDWESIEACNEHGATMVFTGQRAFKH
ncbi:MAG: IMP cyclohydrolase [Proteobacteria bacterium]|nr:IMP cyclohydrolase [Pseudomonadota bacterium]